ncbi:MAG: hypothetical protein OXU43_02110, partial [Gammaproteobacteria bacterium]|nr:hypothetical protein [Gammaproteobacteria bacterium]
AQFCGGDITGNGGIPLLGTVDRKLGLTRALARMLRDTRRKASCTVVSNYSGPLSEQCSPGISDGFGCNSPQTDR